MPDSPIMIPIAEIVKETEHVNTYYFDYPLGSEPGQFVMLWIPGIDQKPFSIGYDDGKRFGLTIFALGKLTHALAEMKVGDRVGITGPYGTTFRVESDRHYIMIAGGYGAAPLGLLSERLQEKNVTVDFCVGARGEEHLLFEDRMTKLDYVTTHVSTDNGSKGHHGYVTDILKKLLEGYKGSDKNILVATCGPELMEKKVLELCNEYNVDCDVSIERFMKCGFGICGQCCVDPLGITMCKQGPVVPRDLVNKITEFGSHHRDKSGAKHNY